MKAKQYDKGVRDSLKRREAISRKKRHDYATSDDVLANFKRLGKAVKELNIPKLWETKPALAYALFMCLMKIDRLVNLLSQGKIPSNEAFQDTWDDLSNYVDLAHAIYVESENLNSS